MPRMRMPLFGDFKTRVSRQVALATETGKICAAPGYFEQSRNLIALNRDQKSDAVPAVDTAEGVGTFALAPTPIA